MKTRKRNKLGLQTLGSRNPVASGMSSLKLTRRVESSKKLKLLLKVARQECSV